MGAPPNQWDEEEGELILLILASWLLEIKQYIAMLHCSRKATMKGLISLCTKHMTYTLHKICFENLYCDVNFDNG